MAGTLSGHWSLGWICGVGFDGMSKNYWLVRCCCATIEFGLGWTVDIASGLVCGHGWFCALILFIRHKAIC